MSTLESWLPVLVAISTVISIILLLLTPLYASKRSPNNRGDDNKSLDRIQIVVLGDIGHSPRMQYHALSIAKHGVPVDLIGYQESSPHPEISSNPLITVHPVPPFPAFAETKNSLLSLLSKPLKVIFQFVVLLMVLRYRVRPAKWMIVQNPPLLPSLDVALIVAFLQNTRVVVDWHNFGHSRLSDTLRSQHPFVRLYYLHDRIMSRYATAHFTVTNAMARVLRTAYCLSANVLPLHDRPASHYQPITDEKRSEFLQRLPETSTFFDSIQVGKAKLLVSSTSWTPDEDFGVLLDALVEYSDLAMTSHPHLPEILVVVTGKGPLKDGFLAKIAMLKSQDKLEMITFKTAWLSPEDYASLLASADLGVSLHQSSSGVDLPMKVLDMFGAGTPVVGWSDFEAWPELVQEGVNGRGFKSAAGLQSILMELFTGDGDELQVLKQGALREGSRRWDDEWDWVAGRFLGLCP